MEEPSDCLGEKPSSRLRLVCSFNGAFHITPPFNQPCYIGGETRIVSVERNVSISKLRSRIADIFPNIRFFSLKYRLPVTGCARMDSGANVNAVLVSIESDDDVRCMIEECDKLKMYGGLWIFVCCECENKSDSDSGIQGNIDKRYVICVDGNSSQTEFRAEHRKKQSFENPLIDLSLKLNIITMPSESVGVNLLLSNKRGSSNLQTYGGSCNVIRVDSEISGQFSQPLKEVFDYGFDGKEDFSYMMPWAGNSGSVETPLAPICCSNQTSANGKPIKSSYFGDWILSSYPNGVQSQTFGVSDTRNQCICPYDKRISTNGLVDRMRNEVSFIVEGEIPVGECNLEIPPTSEVSSNNTNLLKPSRNSASTESCLNKGNFSFDDQYRYSDSTFGCANSNMEESELGYYFEGQGVDDECFLSLIADRNATSSSMVIHTQEDLSSDLNYTMISSNLENDKFLDESEEDAVIFYLSDNAQLSKEHLITGVASSVDLLSKLSLSYSKEMDTSEHSSLASNEVSYALTKSQLKSSDAMDYATQFSLGFLVDELNTDTSDIRSIHVNEEGIGQADCECLKAIAGVSSAVKSLCNHLASGELLAIKSWDLEYIKELGSGAYGTVFYGKWKGFDVAIKKIKPKCLTGNSREEERLVKDFCNEAYILSQLHHPNIVAMYGVVTDGPVTNLAAVTEYMVNGSLKQVLHRKDRTIDCRKRLLIAIDAAVGMEYLHAQKIVHFDLKSDNFLVNMRDPLRPVCKIGDLGLSKIRTKTLVLGGMRGTIPWMAPELLNKDKLVTEKIDVYSFGIVMWELLTAEEPYKNLHHNEIIAGIIKGTLRPEIPLWCNPSWRSLMERCWSSVPDSRPSFTEIAEELRSMAAALNIK